MNKQTAYGLAKKAEKELRERALEHYWESQRQERREEVILKVLIAIAGLLGGIALSLVLGVR